RTAVPPRVRVMLGAFGGEVMRRERARNRVAGGGLVERLLVDDELLLRLDQVQEVVDAREDLRAVGGLGDEIVRPGRARALLGGVVLVPGDHDHGHAADALILGLADALEQRETVQHRHLDVGEYHHDGGIGRDRLPAGLAVRLLPDFETLAYQARERRAHDLGIVHQKHALLRDLSGDAGNRAHVRPPDRPRCVPWPRLSAGRRTPAGDRRTRWSASSPRGAPAACRPRAAARPPGAGAWAWLRSRSPGGSLPAR